MKKKMSLEIIAPATLVFSVVSIILFALDYFAVKGQWSKSFMLSPAAGGDFAFNFSSAISYFRLFCYSFSASSWEILITNILFVLFLGPAMEEKYGSVIIGLMMLVSVLFAGVLYSCFCNVSAQGCSAIIFMFIFLNAFVSFSKKKIPVTFLLVFVLFIAREVFLNNPNGVVGIAVGVAGGLCGSLFALLATPRKKNTSTETDVTSRFAKPNKSKGSEKETSEDDKETVIGTLHF